jgi:hypothetical protein
MGNGDNRYRSRKFLLAVAAFVCVTAMAFYGEYRFAKTAADTALIIGSWGTPVAVILGLYSHYNVKEEDQ